MMYKENKFNFAIKSIVIVFLIVCSLGIRDKVYVAKQVDVYITREMINEQGVSNAIQSGLDEARDNATQDCPYVVHVAPGKYGITKALLIYSNTTIDLKDVTLKKNAQVNIIKVGAIDTYGKGVLGLYYENISINGGIFDANNYYGTIIKIAHAKNIRLQDATLVNDYNGHAMEVAALDGLVIDNCTFKDMELEDDASVLCYEAIQLDVLHKKHMNGYRSEALPNKNVKITNCHFENVARAIGSHTAIYGKPHSNIEISGCTFKNVESAAIQSLYWKEVVIKNNKFTNCVRGISIYYMKKNGRGIFNEKQFAQDGNYECDKEDTYYVDENQNILIQNNEIQINHDIEQWAKYTKIAIMVAGNPVDSIEDWTDESGMIPKGNYYVTGIKVLDNKIVSAGYGIMLQDAKNAVVSRNTIVGQDSVWETCRGVAVISGSSNIEINNNSISAMPDNGIYVYDKSRVNKINNNKIFTCEGAGIKLNKNAVCENGIFDNTFTEVNNGGVVIQDNSTCGNIYRNKIKDIAGSPGVTIYNGSKAGVITENNIWINDKTTTDDYCQGIKVSKNSKTLDITDNSIKNTDGSYYMGTGILIYNGSEVNGMISKNQIGSTKEKGISIGINSTVAGDVSNNTVKCCVAQGIHVYTNSTVLGNIELNTILLAKNQGININSTRNDINLINNTVKSYGDTLVVDTGSRWYSVNGKENNIYGSRSHAGIYLKSGKFLATNNNIYHVAKGVLLLKPAVGEVYNNRYNSAVVKKVMVELKKKHEINVGKVASFKVVPKDKNLTLKWKEKKNVSGYYVEYSRTNSFSKIEKVKSVSKKSKSLKVTGLQKKTTYYVRIRSYKKYEGIKVYSNYSSVKKIIVP